MQTNKISKWAALLLTFSGMAALPLTTTAKTLTSGTWSESGSSYQGAGSSSALQFDGAVTYTGSNITLSSTEHNNTGGVGLRLGWGAADADVTLYNSTITVSGTNSWGSIVYTGTATLHDIIIDKSSYNGGGLLAYSHIEINSLTITINGDRTSAIRANETAVINARNINVASSGSRAFGLVVDGNGSFMSVTGGTVVTSGNQAHGVYMGNTGNSTLYLTDVNIESSGLNSAAIDMEGWNATGQKTLVITGGNFVSRDAEALLLLGLENAWDENGVNHITINGASMTGATAVINNQGAGATTIDIDNGSVLSGDVLVSGSAQMTVNLADSQITGTIIGSGSSTTNINLDNSTLTGNTDAQDNSTIIISGSKGSSITGDINSKDNGTIIIDLDDSKYNGGDINSSGSSNITISGSNGSAVTGTANSKDDSTITINIDGPGSSWVGDTNQQDDSKIIININNGGSGTGGFNGGDLNVGKDSEFTFDKDSHGNNGKNDGTWNIGDKDVIFDNMDNNGKIVININSDDQSHGSLDVTGTASGTGIIQPNVTGTTAASQEDQDHIINDLVKGNGKDVWDIGDFDWGLKEETVVTGSDGKLYVKDNGKLSTAGNIAVGLIAAQKGSWFAQQNSLLKRMGELRLQNSVESVTISGKEDKEVSAPMLSADKLIENVWIRAYGQQLNYGASVTGQAFRQYVYGTDIGTDHKWTLDRNNALYAGVFAGYGAADTDHRHYGSKSDISNYYFGLYASWLNDSGWYLDATLKAQYADLHLDGYANGIDYFTGGYNNWSVGGSIEFGKQIKFKDDWFVEPQLQANYLHLLASDYTMSQGLNVNVSDLDVFQLRFGIVAGKTLKLKNGGALQPYFKISGVEMVSTGGKLSAMNNTVRPNLDGARAELGAGIIWQLDAHNQLHLDYEASFGDKYDKPWGLTAGYRYQF